jgi:hypothetical protein
MQSSGVDAYGNEASDDFDLGKDGVFSDFSLLVGQFHGCLHSYWPKTAGAILKKKGFRTTLVNNEVDFIKQIKEGDYDVAWIISERSTNSGNGKQFCDAVMEFHHKKRGLFIWGDNDPYYAQANLILPTLAGCKLVGNNHGDKLLTYGDRNTAGYFDNDNIIFAGVNYLHEGITICYPDQPGKLKTIATGTDGRTCIASMDSNNEGGRVIVDTGFTKMYDGYWQRAGQARYIINACVWLVDIEGRFRSPTEETLKQ